MGSISLLAGSPLGVRRRKSHECCMSDNTLYDEESGRAALEAIEKTNAIYKNEKDDYKVLLIFQVGLRK